MKKVTLSKELSKIFDSSKVFVEENNARQFTIEVVLYKLQSYYCDHSNSNTLECKRLANKINKLDAVTKMKILTRLSADALKSITNSISQKEISSIGKISGTDIFADSWIIESLNRANQTIILGYPGGKNEIGTEDFLKATLIMNDISAVGYFIDNVISIEDLCINSSKSYKYSADDLSSSFSNFFNSLLGGDFSPSTLNYGEDDDSNEDKAKPDKDSEFERAGSSSAISGKKANPKSRIKTLEQFSVDMTEDARNGKYDPVIGRDTEIDQLLEILSCRKKNNAILLGDPGCGKSSIVELLAQRIVEGKVPAELKNKRVFSLDLNALVAGTTFRGQYEERIQSIIKEVVSEKNIIIFIDEFHNLVGNGSSKDGSGDGAQILKPYLARGEFQCIGATTTDEFRKLVSGDGALKRRFQPIQVGEPTLEETKEILKGLADKYEKFHCVKYTDEVISKCVEWSGQYISDQFFPDKAIGVLDMAGALAKLNDKSNKLKLDVEKLSNQIVQMRKDMSDKILNDTDNWEEADKLRAEIEKKEATLSSKKSKLGSNSTNWPTVTLDNVSSVINKLTNIPLDTIKSTSVDKVKGMYKTLTEKVIGQDEACKEVVTALQRNILGLRDPKKPIASYLFVGSTGTGKTHISKIIAKEFFGSEKNIETIACGEFTQGFDVTKLTGAAPGYVGYNSEPVLYRMKKKPYSVLLIDEIEKSNSEIYNVWLQILEEGSVTLNNGEVINLRNCIVIFTGNVGTKSLELKGSGIGFEKLSGSDKRKSDIDVVMKEVKKEFRPEFLNRINKVVVFNSLEKEDLNKIFYLELEKLTKRLTDSNFKLEVSDKVRDLIVSKCEPQYGARSLQRLLIEYVENKICEAMLTQDSTAQNIKVDLSDKDDIEVSFC